MKNFFLIFGLTLLGMASCKKDYTCTCTSNTNYSNGDMDGNGPTVTTYKDVKKVQVGAACADYQRTGTSGGFGGSVTYTTTVDCNLSKD